MLYVLSYAALEFVNFRKIEFDSLAKVFNVQYQTAENDNQLWLRPYVIVHLESDKIALAIVERSILIKSVYHLWSDAETLSELVTKVASLPFELFSPYLNSDKTFKIVLSSAHKKMSQDERNAIMKSVLNAHKKITARVLLKSPDCLLHILVEYRPKNVGKHTDQTDTEPYRFYYGRLLGASKRKDLMSTYCLSDRVYLGNTTMDVRLAGIMANVGLCKKLSMVWDPFLGTGSTVIAASVWGSLGGGSDIDYALLHGIGMSPKAGQGKRMRGECLRTNYEQYNLKSSFLDVMVADITSICRLLRIPSSGLFDAIITDPPYGVRERICRVANERKERLPSLVTHERLLEIVGDNFSGDQSSMEELNSNGLVHVPHDLLHFPHKESYPIQRSYQDLLETAVYLLHSNSRLVFWVPMPNAEFHGLQSLPYHSRLQTLGVCEQMLNSRLSRYMIVMRKLYDDEPDVNQLTEEDEPTILYRSVC